MSLSAILGLEYGDPYQTEKMQTINEFLEGLDDAIGRNWTTTVVTGNHTVLMTEKTILCNHTAATTTTLPATTGVSSPFPGQRFEIKDRSASGAGTYNITIAVPAGKKLDGVTDGTLILAADQAWAEIVFVSDGDGYRTLRAQGTFDTTLTNLTPWHATVGIPPTGANNTAIPTANAAPSWLPFMFNEDVRVTHIIFPFGTSAPTSDATEAKIRFAFYNSSKTTFLPDTVRFASEDFILQGTGHSRDTTSLGLANLGSVVAAVRTCTLSTARYFKAHTLYHLGMHYEGTFVGATVIDGGRGAGHNPVILAAGAQAWPYSFGNSPTVGSQFSSNDEVRPVIVFRYSRMRDLQ